LDELAPATIKVPSGSAIHLEYETNRTEPILPVRIQEVFGMLKTPTVNGGKINVLMHLLSPGFKLVQTTNDLESFWKNVYFEIRKELRIKYKKHEWPENPLVHPPTTGPKKRIQQ
jgi:ATP-dependent helicase HrpB